MFTSFSGFLNILNFCVKVIQIILRKRAFSAWTERRMMCCVTVNFISFIGTEYFYSYFFLFLYFLCFFFYFSYNLIIIMEHLYSYFFCFYYLFPLSYLLFFVIILLSLFPVFTLSLFSLNLKSFVYLFFHGFKW